MLGATYILVVIVMRMCDGSLRGAHQGLSVLLLLALLAQLSSVVLFVLPAAQHLVCHLKLYLPPMLLVTCYSILLAKLLHLRHYASAGLGGHVPQFPLYLAVLLSIAVQAAVSAHYDAQQQLQQQLLHFDCYLSRDDLPLLYLFVVVLVCMTAVYSLTLRSIRQQQAEAQWIFVTSCVSALVLLTWAVACGWNMPLEYRDAATASLLVVLAAVVLACIFIPVMTKLHPLRASKHQHQQPNPHNVSAKLSTYTCNISVASTIPNPWLNHFNDTPLRKSCCADTGATSQLSGSHLLRHPTYTGRL